MKPTKSTLKYLIFAALTFCSASAIADPVSAIIGGAVGAAAVSSSNSNATVVLPTNGHSVISCCTYKQSNYTMCENVIVGRDGDTRWGRPLMKDMTPTEFAWWAGWTKVHAIGIMSGASDRCQKILIEVSK